jgi:hypothetical protein
VLINENNFTDAENDKMYYESIAKHTTIYVSGSGVLKLQSAEKLWSSLPLFNTLTGINIRQDMFNNDFNGFKSYYAIVKDNFAQNPNNYNALVSKIKGLTAKSEKESEEIDTITEIKQWLNLMKTLFFEYIKTINIVPL